MSPFELGKIAYENGATILTNPYSWEDRMQYDHWHTMWNDGWLAASRADTSAGRLHKMLSSTGVSMQTCLAAQERYCSLHEAVVSIKSAG